MTPSRARDSLRLIMELLVSKSLSPFSAALDLSSRSGDLE
jgi:hypothetical protein